MEEEWIVDRARLRELMSKHPRLAQRELAHQIGRSVGWVKKWRQRLRAAHPNDDQVLHRRTSPRCRPRTRRTVRIVERVLDIRDHPPDHLRRTPGPKAILYYLSQDEQLRDCPQEIPRSTRTVWQILDEAGRVVRRAPPEHQPLERADPLQAWQIDWKDVTTVPADPEGKHRHMIEILNVVDTGTSILLDSLPRADYAADTALLALTNSLLVNGLPQSITFDRDPRLVGSWTTGDFPSALVRYLLCLDIQVNICPPHQPNKNAFVERFNRTQGEECLQVHRPATLEDVRQVTQDFRWHYNHERPNQALSCGNRPPYVAFPSLPKLPPLPDQVDPDRWLLAVHRKRFKRRVNANGSIQVDKHDYYVSTRLRGRLLVFQVDAFSQELFVEVDGKPFKQIPIKGLHHGFMPFQDFLKLMCHEALAEARRFQRTPARRPVYELG
jgi:hypothetical protein